MMRISTLAFVTVLAGAAVSLAYAQGGATEPALAKTFKDKDIQWGPCPPFMPKGCQVAVLHGNPGQPNADLFFMVPPGSSIPEHWHTSPERMVMVSGELTVTYKRQQPVTLKKGHYAYGPAKAPHRATCAKREPCVLFIAFEGPVDAHPTSARAAVPAKK